jgi:predicted PolB exonuclease-like 3'-5' exonuclease
MELFLDIETIPAQRPDILAHLESSMHDDIAAARDSLAEALESVKAPANYKDEAKIADYITERKKALLAEFDAKLAGFDAKLADKIAGTGLDGAFGQVFCIGWAWDDGGVNVLYRKALDSQTEADVLRSFFAGMPSGLRQVRVIGHNVASFDLRFIKQRAMVLGVKPPLSLPFDAKPWDETIFDTMVQFAGVGKTIGLDRLALAFGIAGKLDGHKGADVWPMVQAGRFEEVADYCVRDVELTREVYRRMTFSAPAAERLAA